MAILTLNERMVFMAEVANRFLSEFGQSCFYRSFYYRINKKQFLTHKIINQSERELGILIARDKYREMKG